MPPEPTTAPTTEQIKDAVAAATVKEGDFPGEYKLGDGTVVKAKTWEEAFQAVATMKTNTAAALRDREEQIRQLQETKHQVIPNNTTTTATAFDQKRYWELMNDDVIAGQNYLDSFRLGVDNPNNVPLLFNEMRNVSVYSADNMEIQSFMQRNPDFPGTDEAADMLINRLAARNAPLTADGLEYEYLKGVRDGEIEPLGPEAERPFVPPNLGSGVSLSREDADIMQQVRDVPDDKLDDFYRRLGLLK